MSRSIVEWILKGVPLAALALGVVGLIRDCKQENRLDELNHGMTALQYRPLLKVVGTPDVLSYELEGQPFRTDTLLKATESDSVLDIYARLTVDLRFAVVNDGNAVARIYSIVLTDSSSGADLARRRILNSDFSGFKLVPDSSYFRTESVTPGDTAYFNESYRVNFSDKSTFTLHFLILYQNEMKALYDTYHWARFSTREIWFRNYYRIEKGRLQIRSVPRGDDLRKFLQFVDGNESYYAYDRSEAGAVQENLQTWAAGQ
jgi:hypothetical protein